ncbi:hypothetical protein ABEX78_32365 [Priestia megaterium]
MIEWIGMAKEVGLFLCGTVLALVLQFSKEKRRDEHKKETNIINELQVELDKLRERIALLEEKLEKTTEKIIVLERENSSLKVENKHLEQTIKYLKG